MIQVFSLNPWEIRRLSALQLGFAGNDAGNRIWPKFPTPPKGATPMAGRGRKSSVRYWSTRGTWTDESGQKRQGAYCCEIDGKQHTLAAGPDDAPKGPTYLAATKKFGEIV